MIGFPLRPSVRLLFLVCAMIAVIPSFASAEDQDKDKPAETERTTYKESVVVERTTTTREKQVTTKKAKDKYTCAIFVANRSKLDDQKVLVMQDFLIGHATEKGFRIIAREDVINSVAKLAEAGPNKGDKRLPGEELDELLSNNTSAMRLAQNLNADYVLMISITSFGTTTTRFNDPAQGINIVGKNSRLKATYRLLDTTIGGSQIAGVATASTSKRVDSRTVIDDENVVDDLLDASAEDLSDMMGKAARSGGVEAPAVASKGGNSFEVHCGVADLTFPEIQKDEHNQYVVVAGHYRLESLAVTVEMDGVVIGTTPGPFTAKPGLHKLRLRREKFKEWQGTVNISDGQVLQVALQMTPQGLDEFAAMTKFFQDLKTNTILSEAQAKAWEGYAKQMEQSGVRIQKNVNIDENIKIHGTKSSDLPRKQQVDPDQPRKLPAPPRDLPTEPKPDRGEQ